MRESDGRLMSQDIDYRRVRRYVDENLSKRKNRTQQVFFFVSLLMFILFNLIVWIVFNLGQYGENAIGGGIMLSVGWGVSILYHFINLMLNTKVGEQQLRESLTLRGIQHEMARLGMADMSELGEMEKPKRHETVQLSDDGELVDADTDAEPPARKTSARER